MWKKMYAKWAMIPILTMMLINSSLVIAEDSQGSNITRLGNTIVVDQSGSGDYTNIQDAIDHASNQDKIIIYDGLYNEEVTIDKEVIIEGRDSVILNGTSEKTGFYIYSNNVSLNNLKINNFLYGIRINENIYNTTFNNIHFNNSYYHCIYFSPYCDGIKIMNCTFSYQNRSIYIYDSNINTLIENCKFLYTNEVDIVIQSENTIIRNNYIYSNIIDGKFKRNIGIIISNSDNSMIYNNTFIDCEYGVFLINSKCIIENCNFNRCDVGINLRSTDFIFEFSNLSFSSCNIGLESYNMITFLYDSIFNNCQRGLYFTADNNELHRNLFKNCDTSIELRGDYNKINKNIINNSANIGILLNTCEWNTITENYIESSNIGIHALDTKFNRIATNYFINNSVNANASGEDLWYFAYPDGGNYWDDYTGSDRKNGEKQDIAGSDGFGDTPYYFDPTQFDLYPIYIDNVSPIAEELSSRKINNGDIIRFNGSGSYDDQMIILWVWNFFYDGQNQEINGEFAEFQFNIPGIYNITLSVYDYVGNSDSVIFKVTVVDVDPPVALSQGDMTVDQGVTATFDASGSTDNWLIDSYQWTFIYNGVEQVLDGARPSFKFVIPGVYEVNLTVFDPDLNKGTTTFIVTVIDTEDPVAVAGNDNTINNGETIYFDATESSDNGVIESYEWTFDYDGEMKTLTGDKTSFNFFIAGTYVINLTITDGDGNIGIDTLVLIVLDTIDPEPKVTGSLEVLPGKAFDLSAETSTDNHMISRYLWTFYDPDQQEIEGPTFSHLFSRSGKHTVDLRVWDPAGNTANITFQVNVLDTSIPVAFAGHDIKVAVNTKVDLDASGSTDDGVIVKYEWKITDDSGFRVDLEGLTAEYTFENTGTYTALLSVIDSADNIGSDTIFIEVVNTGTLTGVVLDKSGDPIAGATITVTDSNGNKHTTKSVSDGSFSIDIPAGSVTWEISANGYDKAKGSSTVELLGSSEIDSSKSTLSESTGSSPVFIIIVILVILVVILLIIGLVVFFVIKSKSKGEEEPGDDDIKACDEPTQDLIPEENEMI